MGEIAIDKKVTNDHTFGYLFGLVKVRHILTEQYIRAQTQAMCGKGEYIHTVKVYVCGTEVFSFEGHCGRVGEVYIEGDQLVGSTLIKKKRL
jgi:hypothetical protein